MSMDFIPAETDYTISRAERRRKLREDYKFYKRGNPKINPPRWGGNRKMTRSGVYGEDLEGLYVDYDKDMGNLL